MGSSLGKPKTPAAPDYGALAQQQGQANLQAQQQNTAANRVNQVGPGGSVTWAMRPGADPNNPQAGDWTQTTALSPEQQALYNSENRISQQFANMGESQLGRVNSTLGQEFDTSGLPALQGGVDPRTGQAQRSPTAGPVQGQIQTGQLPQLGGDYESSRQAVVDAMMSRSAPELDRQQAARENQLMNSGIERGSEAWTREMDAFGRQRNDLQMQAQLAGGQEQSRLHGMAASDRGQLFGEGVTSGNFANTAQNQQFTQGLASAGFNNDILGQEFGRDLSAATFGNQARGQGMQEQSYLRNLPLNEVNALRSGAQVQSPTFSPYYTSNAPQAAPIFDAGMAQGNYNLQAAGNQQSGYNSLLGGLARLGSAWIGS